MSILQVSSALALAAAAGLNTTLPLLLVGLLAHWGQVTLPSPYNFLGNPFVLAGLTVLALVEFATDKVPLLAHAVHFIQWPVATLAGAFLTAGQIASGASHGATIALLMAPVALAVWIPLAVGVVLIGGIIAAAVHAGRAIVRPVMAASTLGIGTAIVSALEDVYALLLAGAALLLPLLGLVLLVLLLGVLVAMGLLLARLGRGLHQILG